MNINLSTQKRRAWSQNAGEAIIRTTTIVIVFKNNYKVFLNLAVMLLTH